MRLDEIKADLKEHDSLSMEQELWLIAEVERLQHNMDVRLGERDAKIARQAAHIEKLEKSRAALRAQRATHERRGD